MPELDQILAPPGAQPATREVLEGELVERSDGLYARIDDRSALWGPVVDGTNGRASDGMTALICVAQSGRPWVVAVDG
jgi:hypothetical protein